MRIATFNLENLDDRPGETPSLAARIAVMRPQLARVNADVLCLQEVNGQTEPDQSRRLRALEKLLEETPYANFHRVSTLTQDGEQFYLERNLVILSRFEIIEHDQHKHDFAPAPRYRRVTAAGERDAGEDENEAGAITWERPILRAAIRLDETRVLHVINLHLKSRLPTDIPGQKLDAYTWKSASGWAEGSFISSMKRVGQALETRIFIDTLFDENDEALIAVCGDFNAEPDEVPLEALRGDVENTGNGALANRVLVPCVKTIPQSNCFSLLHLGKGRMIDNLLVSRALLAHYQGVEIHNELLHDESIAFATDVKYPESDHAPVIAEFDLGL